MEFLKTPKAAIILALVYFVFPLDLVPDIFGPFGRFDDLIIFGMTLWRVIKDRQERAKEQQRSEEARQQKLPLADRESNYQFGRKIGANDLHTECLPTTRVPSP